MAVDALVRGGGIVRQADGKPEGGTTPYPVHQVFEVEVLRQATTRVLGSGALSDEFPPLADPQQVFGHALVGFVQPVPDFTGELLAGLFVGRPEFVPEGASPWQIGWIARVGESGEVTIYEGGEGLWDAQLAELAGLLQRDNQYDLLVDWVTEALAEKEGAEPGPITVAFNAAFVPPEEEPLASPSIEVPIYIQVDVTSADASNKVVVQAAGFDTDDFEASEWSLSQGSGTMTGMMAPGAAMRIRVWDDGIPISAASLEAEQWERVVSGRAGGVLITVAEDLAVNAIVLSQVEFSELLQQSSG